VKRATPGYGGCQREKFVKALGLRTHPRRSHFPNFHPLCADAQETGHETQVASVDQHVRTGNDAVEKVVRLGLSPRSVQPVGLGQERGIGNGGRGRLCNDVELGVCRDQQGQQGESLLMGEMSQEAGKQFLAFGRVEQCDERVRGAIDKVTYQYRPFDPDALGASRT
jgi:hypothetical protein